MSARYLLLAIFLAAAASCAMWASHLTRWIIPRDAGDGWSPIAPSLVASSSLNGRSLRSDRRNESLAGQSSRLSVPSSQVAPREPERRSQAPGDRLPDTGRIRSSSAPPPPPSFPRLRRRHGHLSSTPRIASHILVRGANGSWTPRWENLRTLASIDGMFPADGDAGGDADGGGSGRGHAAGMQSRHEFLGFIRITKTGTTSLLRFLNSAERLQTFDRYMRHSEFKDQMREEGVLALHTQYLAPPCVFGHHLLPGQAAPDQSHTGDQCQHLTYYQVASYFARALGYYRGFGGAARPAAAAAAAAAGRVSLDLATIVREPAERYLSYFHYWRKIYPAWNSTAQGREREALVSGDFEGFVRQIAVQPRRGLNSFQQYEYLASPSAEYAIDLVRDRRVLPLVNECFDASLLLLADLYPRFVSRNETLRFVRSGESAVNTRSQRELGPDGWAKKGLEPVKEFDLDRVKSRARAWLADEYRLYEAAVQVFLQILQASSVDRDEVRNCIRRLQPTLKSASPASLASSEETRSGHKL